MISLASDHREPLQIDNKIQEIYINYQKISL